MINSNMSNEELLLEYANGQYQAFDIFYKRNHKAIFLYILSQIGHKAEAEDILQETFLRIHRYIHRYDPQKKAMPWVFTIAKNRVLSKIQTQKHHTSLDEVDLASHKLTSEEARSELHKIFQSINDPDLQLLLNRLLNEKSFQEISEESGISVENARQKLSRILKKIRQKNSFKPNSTS